MKNRLLNSLTKILSVWFRQSNGDASKVIHERSIFKEIIELERDRAHRANQQFSMILINVGQEKKLAVVELVHQISKRIRRIDQVGWYDPFHIGVLLPSTTPDGAQNIVKDIRGNCPPSQASFQYQTLSYPDAN